MSQLDQTLTAASSLPITVSLQQVEAMIAAFPIPNSTPVWKSTTMKVAAAGAIGTSALIAFWPTENEAPTPKYEPQIQVPIKADSASKEVERIELEPISKEMMEGEAAKIEEEKPFLISPKVMVTDTDSLVSAAPIKPIIPVAPINEITAIYPIEDIGLFEGEGGSSWLEEELETGSLMHANHDCEHQENHHCTEHDSAAHNDLFDEHDCECHTSEIDMVEFNKQITTGVMSFYINCESDDIHIHQKEVKPFKRDLKVLLKELNLYQKEVKIAFLDETHIFLNSEELSQDDCTWLASFFSSNEVAPGPNRRILMRKDQIWVGDFSKGKFSGMAQGFNVKKSLADEWLKD